MGDYGKAVIYLWIQVIRLSAALFASPAPFILPETHNLYTVALKF